MDERLVEIRIDRFGDLPTVRTGVSANDVVGLIRPLEGETDVAVTISQEGTDGHLLVAVSGAQAFLGLDGPEGVFQFVPNGKHHGGTQRFMIGGQETDIKSRYVVCVERAANVADEWLKVGRQSSFGAWERQ